MRKEDMIRIIENGGNYQLMDYIQEEFDNIIFKEIEEKKNGKVHFRFTRQVFTSYGRQQKLVISRLHDKRKTVKGNKRIRRSKEIHRSSVRKK